MATSGRKVEADLRAMKERILSSICTSYAKDGCAVTATGIQERLDIPYATVLPLMMELAMSGSLKMTNKNGARFFVPVPQPLEVR